MTHDTTPAAPAAADRRRFLLGTGTLGLAAAGAVVAGPSFASSAAPEAAFDADQAAALEPLMMYVKDAHRGQIAVLIGDREVVYTDAAAVSTFLTAAKG